MIVLKGPDLPEIEKLEHIMPGEEIILFFRKKEEEGKGGVKIVGKRLKLIKRYSRFALFENKKGTKECFHYQEINWRRKKENLEY
jgi:hypothetical protein|uniref:Uncharacterized protein n=1 Tax=Podoviridae sp. ctZ5d16 TaxID=2825257 RepID=A0A8S5Q808_9CAUD|nr:MAG TPA: hypothetical protein [Podoviridae sp. ctZ5d16]